MSKIIKAIIGLSAYTLIALENWKIGIAIFIIHWIINYDMKKSR